MPDVTNESPPTAQSDFEAMLRRYFAKLARRYAPVLAGLVVLALIIVLVPTTQPASTLAANGAGGLAGQVGVGGQAATAGSPAGGAGSGPSSGAGSAVGSGVTSASGPGFATPTPGAVDSGSVSGSDTSAGGVITPGSGTTAPSGGSAGGVARSGVTCGPNVRQFSWSGRSPYCVAAFHGNNGGSTAQGVTGSTITLTFRIPNSAEDDTIAALAGTANVNYPAMVADLKTYIAYFNTQFELYGRHVVLKAYNGQGDYIQEDQGQNLAGAQADAVSAHDMGAFGDVTFSLGSSQPYEEDLAAEHVISFSSVAQPQSWYLAHAPYEFSVQSGSGTTAIQESAAVVCRRLAGMPAIFSGDVLAQHTKRVFGIIYPENPNYAAEVAQYKQILSGCGVSVAKTVAYAINVSQYTQEALSTVALMKAAGVTTVLCACDPIFPILLTPAASAQAYHPEWFGADFGDPVTQDYTSSEWGHEIAGGVAFPPPTQTEAYHVYELANPGHQPAEDPPASPPYYYVPYYTLLQVFEGLQAAGPDLTPANFEAGMFSLPPSTGSDAIGGQWVFGNDVFDPVVSFGLVWWNPKATSPFDGKAGTYEPCNGGQIYTVSNLAALGPPGHQLQCFGL